MKKEKVKARMVVGHQTGVGTYFVKVKSAPDRDGNVTILGGPETWAHVSELRPLTAREKGESQ